MIAPVRAHLAGFTTPMLFIAALLFAGLTLTATPAAASGDADQRIAEMLEEAREDYDMLFFEDAVTTIHEGLDLAESEGIRTAEVAEMHIFLGLIRHADGDDDLAVDAFVDAFEIDPDVEVDPMYVTPNLEELLEQAEDRAEPPSDTEAADQPPAGDPDPRLDDAPPEEEVDPLTHEPLRRADAGEPLTIEAEIPADLPVFGVFVHHRRYGEDEFAQDEMEPVDATGFEIELGGDKIRTTQIEYFITAIDRTGEVVAESGRTTKPHRMSIIGQADESQEPEDPEDPETPDDEADPDEPPADAPVLPEERDPTGPYVSLMGGTDVGFLPGGTPPTAHTNRTVSPGLAPAFAHTQLDAGWQFTEFNSLGLYFRWQFVPAQDLDHIREEQGYPEHIAQNASFWEHRDECFGLGLPGDCLLGLKYRQILTSDIPEIYSSVGLGIGRVRNWLTIKQATDADDPHPTCQGRETLEDAEAGPYCELRDTVRTGWAHFGVGGGLHVPLPGPDGLDFVADTYLMVLVPDTSVNLDLNAGVRYSF